MNAWIFFAVFSLVISLSAYAEPEAEQQPPTEVPAAASPDDVIGTSAGAVWVDDELPSSAKTDGEWIWDTATTISGERSHGHPSAKGIQKHSFTADRVLLPADAMLLQQVWLDPKDPPKGIMLKFKLAAGDEVGVYWEGEEEVFSPGEEEQVWYYGLLPELGKWSSLEVIAEDLGLSGENLSGITFITYGGRALWDKTEIRRTPASQQEEASSDIPRVIQGSPDASE